jgi:anti-sigma regulatory factor (Ser/Thr protein kinase)
VREISLHLLDIAENSVAAGARNITIFVEEDLVKDKLNASVVDDGRGMDAEMVKKVVDPFVTSRTTRKVGLGIPLFKEAAEACEGGLDIQSEPGKGTGMQVTFRRSHIDRMPLGDLSGTILSLVVAYPEVHWVFVYKVHRPGSEPEVEFTFDDQPIKDTLDGVSLSEPGILGFVRSLIEEGVEEVQKAAVVNQSIFTAVR